MPVRQRLLILMGIFAAGIWAACNRPSPSPSARNRVSEEATQLNVEMASAENADKKIEPKLEPSASNEPIAEVAELTDVANKKPTVPVNSSERVAILTPDGPIVAEVSVSIDGRSAADTFDDVLAKLLAAADSNNDNRPTWQELAANTKYMSTQGESMPDRVLSQLKTWTEQFDRNRDAQIQRDEAAGWLGCQAGTTARAFDVRGTRSYTSFRSAASRVWKLLDADQNNRLTKEEVARARQPYFH